MSPSSRPAVPANVNVSSPEPPYNESLSPVSVLAVTVIEPLVRKAAKAYYEGNPIMSDVMYDHLAELANIEDVGYSLNSEKRFPHLYPMFSLQKIWEGEERPQWKEAYVSPKFDGAAVSILIAEGEFQKALTRGDGKEGLDITHNMSNIVPNRIEHEGVLQISGEVVAPKTIPNARNYAAGALGLKSSKEFATRDLYFVAHGASPYITDNYVSDMRFIADLGFETAISSDYTQFPQDGSVFRVADNDRFDAHGYTSHHPRGAFALKKQETGVITTLQSVSWQVGKSGAVSPVAHFDPIDIEGATVSKATLHNKSIIEALNLELGCKIEVIRAGKIIPQVLRRVD